MSDEAELSISELRRKRAQTQANNTPAGGSPSAGNPPPTGSPPPAPEPVRHVIEPTIIEATPRHAQSGYPPSQPVYAAPTNLPPTRPSAAFADGEENKPLPFDPWRLPTALKRRWYWLIIGGLLLAALGVAAGRYRAKFFTRVSFTLRDLSARYVPSPLEGDAYKPRQIARQTMINFLNSSPLLARVSSLCTNPPIAERQLLSSIVVAPDRDSDNVAVTINGKNVLELVKLANVYSSNAVELSTETMSRDPLEECGRQSNNLVSIQATLVELSFRMASFLKTNSVMDPEMQKNSSVQEFELDRRKLDDLQFELKAVVSQLQGPSTNATIVVPPEVLKAAKRLADAKEELQKKYDSGLKDAHPDIIRAKEVVTRREHELAEARKISPLTEAAAPDSDLLIKRAQLIQSISDYEARVATNKFEVERISPLIVGYLEIKALTESTEKSQRICQNRLTEAQQYLKSAEGYYDPPNIVSSKDVDTRTRYKTMVTYGILGGIVGGFLSIAIVLLLEITDSRLKTAADVKRVTELPVLAGLGDLKKMDDAARKAWAFRTWTILSGTLSKSANRGTVCGLISCSHGEGRTTWVELLVDAARQRGFEVTKLDFGQADDRAKYEAGESPESGTSTPAASTPDKSKDKEKSDTAFDSSSPAPSPGLPATPANLKMMQAKAASVIHVQLPGLVWNLERRIQFQDELDKWQTVSSAVILIDLPPASVPEAILLAENLPQILWLVDSGKSKAGETRMHLETLRHARCKLVGAVLNHEPVPLMKL